MTACEGLTHNQDLGSLTLQWATLEGGILQGLIQKELTELKAQQLKELRQISNI